jgi:hypothetical protein
VRLSSPAAAPTVVRYVTSGGTASAGSDYRRRAGVARIRTGASSAAITIRVVGDASAEPTETVGVRVTGAGGGAVADGLATVTIRDDENAAGISIGDAQVWEGDRGTGVTKLTVVLSRALPTNTAVRYVTASGTARAPTDHVARTGRVKIRAGRTSAAIKVTTIGDTIMEGNEGFRVLLSGNPAVPIADSVGTVTVRDDESATTSPPPPPPPPPPPVPGAPTALSVSAGPFARYLTAAWTAPATGGPLTGYDLEVVRGTTLNVVAGVTNPYAFGCGLAVVTDTCTVRVRARNAHGDGPWSDPVSASTWAPPDAPPSLTVLAGGGAVTWAVPASDRPVSHYEVQKQPLGGTSWTHVAATTSTHAATTCGNCSVRVSAYSEVGFGAWSTVSIALPGAPAELGATRDPLDHELVHLSWSPPSDPGSHPVTSYEIFVNGFPLPATSGTTTDVFLRSTLAWDIQVYAHNLIGRSFFPVTVTLSAG